MKPFSTGDVPPSRFFTPTPTPSTIVNWQSRLVARNASLSSLGGSCSSTLLLRPSALLLLLLLLSLFGETVGPVAVM